MDWTVKILPVRITNNPDTSAWCSDMATGIEWAADHGAKVINLSYETSGCPGTIESASQYAQARGALVFVSAGNSAMDLSGQYAIPHSFVLVGATDISDQRAMFSNYGAPIILGAPGANILTTQPGGYGTANGTSFSAPVAAGVAALIYSLNPSWSPTIVENLMLATAKSMGTNQMGYGRVDAGAALAAAQNCLAGSCAVPSPLGSTPPPTPNQPPASVTASASTVHVYPNPWKSNQNQNFVTFANLGANDVKIYTISGREVKRLATNTWDMTNDSGERVASGVYLYLASDTQGQQTRGKLAVIR